MWKCENDALREQIMKTKSNHTYKNCQLQCLRPYSLRKYHLITNDVIRYDSLALKLLSNFFELYFFLNCFELYSKCFELHNYAVSNH